MDTDHMGGGRDLERMLEPPGHSCANLIFYTSALEVQKVHFLQRWQFKLAHLSRWIASRVKFARKPHVGGINAPDVRLVFSFIGWHKLPPPNAFRSKGSGMRSYRLCSFFIGRHKLPPPEIPAHAQSNRMAQTSVN